MIWVPVSALRSQSFFGISASLRYPKKGFPLRSGRRLRTFSSLDLKKTFQFGAERFVGLFEKLIIIQSKHF